MSTHRSRRIGRRTAERLLRDAPGHAQVTGHDRLGDLLAAAAAPARDRELTGEHAAMAAFRDARLAPAPQRRRPRMLKIALANLVTVKIAAVAAAAAGGIALAAAAGTLPGQQREEPAPAADTDVVATTSVTTTEKSKAPDKKPDNSASPSPSLHGLCQAYTAGAGAEHGKAHENPAFSALITAAGGPDKVPAFCADLLGDKSGKPDAPGKPDTPGKPDAPGKSDQAPGKPSRSNR
ncbi:hypothetical protein C8D88_104393 [Lentzea atacamensis]|uniref:Uncharacterized protein n=1 Tax=Lentzea atacamensis TaxID=531938 RepID=A0A316I9Z7_9PSEU|nr:hypothetical protein [Lentzea atacamensis]PWK87232.1 hypothetical protein C8D88_104393 [Lentzea atacamensis]